MVATEYAKAKPDFSGNINGETITSESGVNVDDISKDCKAYIDATIARTSTDTGITVAVTDFKYYDIKTETLYVYDFDDGGWDVYKSGDRDFEELDETCVTVDGIVLGGY
jgi:hypothetical protein